MHFTKVKGILSSKNGMNLFRGCTHGCIFIVTQEVNPIMTKCLMHIIKIKRLYG